MLDQTSLKDQDDVLLRLEERLGRLYARQRLGIEQDHEGQVFGGGINFFHIENWYSIHSLIKIALKTSGLYWRGVTNTAKIQLQHHHISDPLVPEAFRVYHQAAHAGFNVMLSGHTHGGQICLPGGVPIELNAVVPRRKP